MSMDNSLFKAIVDNYRHKVADVHKIQVWVLTKIQNSCQTSYLK